MLALIALGALLAGAAAPTPAPGPTPAETALPVIGTTRAKPVCTALRLAVAPAVAAVVKADLTYGGMRKRIFDYVLKDSNDARDLHLMQMDREVDKLVTDVDALESALRSPSLVVTPATGAEDAKALHDLRSAIADVLFAQRVQLDAMNGFVENERLRRFRRLDESGQQVQNTLWPSGPLPGGSALGTPPPVSALVDGGLRGARLFDRSLADVHAYAAKAEDAALKVIAPASNDCQ